MTRGPHVQPFDAQAFNALPFNAPPFNAPPFNAPPFNAPPFNAPPFNAGSFDALSEMIGEDGAREMVDIFEAETRQRLRRLATGGQDMAALVREMHTLKGAAGTVASPRLAEFGRTLERAAQRGVVPSPDHLKAIETALEAFLTEARTRNELRSAAV